jgi:hypothetical protein
MESFQNKTGLLLGNGVNLLDSTQSVSWAKLLNQIKKQYNINVDIDNEFKPFPIGFEEMLHLKEGGNTLDSKLKNLKQTIKSIIDQQLRNKDGFNEYHSQLAKLGYNDILTTNYDYALELSVSNAFYINKKKYALNKSEIKFSLKRHYGGFESTRSNIWHIHGELKSSRNISVNSKQYLEESIMIGYEHYSAYLELIQENINGKKGKKTAEYPSLISRIKNKTIGIFWTDMLFTHNIDIIGLGLDFSENHLWWILNRRAMLMRNNELHNSNNDVQINNFINYYYPDIQDEYTIKANDKDALSNLLKKINLFNKTKAIAEVLKSFKVIPKPIKCKTHQEFYDKFIKLKRIELNTSGNLYAIH